MGNVSGRDIPGNIPGAFKEHWESGLQAQDSGFRVGGFLFSGQYGCLVSTRRGCLFRIMQACQLHLWNIQKEDPNAVTWQSQGSYFGVGLSKESIAPVFGVRGRESCL